MAFPVSSYSYLMTSITCKISCQISIVIMNLQSGNLQSISVVTQTLQCLALLSLFFHPTLGLIPGYAIVQVIHLYFRLFIKRDLAHIIQNITLEGASFFNLHRSKQSYTVPAILYILGDWWQKRKCINRFCGTIAVLFLISSLSSIRT